MREGSQPTINVSLLTCPGRTRDWRGALTSNRSLSTWLVWPSGGPHSQQGRYSCRTAVGPRRLSIMVTVNIRLYSRFPKNPTHQLLQKSSKSASTTPQRPI